MDRSGPGPTEQKRKLNLTEAQGAFLYHLPFPGAQPLPVADVMQMAGVEDSSTSEILDIVDRLEELRVLEVRAADEV